MQRGPDFTDVVDEVHAAEHVDPDIGENGNDVSKNRAASSCEKGQSQSGVDFLQVLSGIASD